jgi:AcrR family transcriptional regulator
MTRREELLEATVDYLLRNGIANLSLRPLAAATGTKARLLIYHFGSRRQLLAEAMERVRQRVQERVVESGDLMTFWKWATEKKNQPYLRLIFEVQGLAMQKPKEYGAYLRGTLEKWIDFLEQRLKGRERRLVASLIIATFDGLLLDYYVTGDLDRTTRSFRRFLEEIA